MYYSFRSVRSFTKHSSKAAAMGDNCVVFKRIPGTPNPWFVYRVLPNGKIEQDSNFEKKVYKSDDIKKYLKKNFRTKIKGV